VHVLWHSTGASNDDITLMLDIIQAELQKLKFTVIGYSSDGDASYYKIYITR
jgi:hypothetical protein